jgi:competence protein ComEC
MRSVALAAAIILVLFPESIVSASFQLSFAAVIALIATYEVTAEPLKKWAHADEGRYQWYRRPIVYFSAIILTTLVATLATTPLSMAIFNRLTLQAVLGNLLAIPLTGFWIMPTLVVATLSLMFGGWDAAFWALEAGIKILSQIAVYVSALPGSGLMVPSPSLWFYPFFVVGGLLLCIGPWLKARGVGLVCVLFSLVFFNAANLPIGYFAGDRSVFALLQKDVLYVSSLKRGQFYTDQWRQHLGISVDHVELLPKQDWLWQGYHVIADPFKNVIDLDLVDAPDKKKYLRSMGYKTRGAAVLTNSFWRKGAVVDGAILGELGSAFVSSDGSVRFEADLVQNRPWG